MLRQATLERVSGSIANGIIDALDEMLGSYSSEERPAIERYDSPLSYAPVRPPERAGNRSSIYGRTRRWDRPDARTAAHPPSREFRAGECMLMPRGHEGGRRQGDRCARAFACSQAYF